MRTDTSNNRYKKANFRMNRFQGVYWRQLFLTAGMVVLTLLMLGASFFSLSYNYARREKTVEMHQQATVVASLCGKYLMQKATPDTDYFLDLTRFAAAISNVDFLICDTDGAVRLSTHPGPGQITQLPAELIEGIGRNEFASSDTGFMPKAQMMVVVPVTSDAGETVGIVCAVSATRALNNLWQGFLSLFFITAFAVIMITFMATSVTTMRQIKPIREMVQATRNYAQGNFDVRMKDYDRRDEMGELARSFNAMADSLQQTESQRREFIANISHELKTPMTTIAGYTDGILDGTIPLNKEKTYLKLISNESRRLSRMVRRMLDVSQLQAMDPLKPGNHFDICESMRRVLISMEHKINNRELDVEADIPDEPILVRGDNDMITQVVYNLLENATKFARDGSTLYLGLTRMDEKVRVTVRNEGETIPAEELPLLFERFHKSDKSRSEDKDGVGLGLYIVKTIVEQHKEKIVVTSENGVTAFSFSLTTE